MPAPPDSVNRALGQFRAYLECLTYIQIDPRLRGRFGFSDVVQHTLAEAWKDLERVQALAPPDQKRWLRRMLLNNLRERVEKEKAAVRDARLERSLEAPLEQSSCRLKDWLAAEESSPSERLDEQERALRLAEALAHLPEPQRDALVLQKWHGWKLREIADHLGRTTGAVAGLLARGLEKLRTLLPDDLVT
jgi:RNA polymerase sigma-70 factor (ECF subfamily)